MSKDNNDKRPIQRFLRHIVSQDYFTGNGWTKDIGEARTFRDTLEAVRMCTHLGLSDVEMVLRISGGTADLFCTRVR